MDDILADVIPSDIALINFMGTASFDVEDKLKQVSLPIGHAQDHEVWRTLISTLSDGRMRCFAGYEATETPLIWDTGASVCISPHREDFISYKKSTTRIKDLLSSNKVAGEGMVRWTVHDKDDGLVNLELPGYHIPKAEIRLLSPQVLLTLAGGDSFQNSS